MEIIDNIGSIIIYNGTEDRYELLVPRVKVSGTWTDSDISGETAEVKNFCEETWTDEIKTAYQSHIDENLVE
jgi:hypothetical protein